MGFATCLETLLCTRRTEITRQLAARLGWLLEPKEYDKWRDIFNEASNLYNLRSQIVHGDPFNASKIDGQEEQLVDLCRRAFSKILSNEGLLDMFFGRNSKACIAYLESLNLDGPQPGNT